MAFSDIVPLPGVVPNAPLKTEVALVPLTPLAVGILDNNPLRRRAVILNPDAVETLFIGPATVTSVNGFPIGPGESLVLTVTSPVFGVSGAGPFSVRVLSEIAE